MKAQVQRIDGVKRRVAAALVHYPILDREGATVTSAITNIDLHDIARSSHTYGLSDFFVIHPIAAQRELSERIRSHWVSGSGGVRIPDRKPAMENMRVVSSLADAIGEFATDSGSQPQIWTTSASAEGVRSLSFPEARRELAIVGPPVLLCFGTGWGLSAEVHELAAARLEPVNSPRADGYNHLSVRAAAAIIFDRLLGVS